MKPGKARPFKSTAPYYVRFRPGYPPELFEHLKKRLQLDGTGRLLDLGCGPGTLTLPMAPAFAHAVGMDPESEMIAAARAEAQRLGVANVTWIEGGSQDLDPRFGKVRLVTMASSFHWMDRARTLEELYALVDTGGGIGVIAEEFLSVPDNAWWREAVVDVVRRVVSQDPWRELRVSKSGERHEAVIARSPFERMEIWSSTYVRTWDIERIIGVLYSLSWASVEVLGEHRARIEADVRRALAERSPDGLFEETVRLDAILASKT